MIRKDIWLEEYQEEGKGGSQESHGKIAYWELCKLEDVLDREQVKTESGKAATPVESYQSMITQFSRLRNKLFKWK